MRKITAYLLVFISLLMIISSGVYYISSLAWFSWLLSLAISIALGWIAIRRRWIALPGKETTEGKEGTEKKIRYFIPFSVFFLAFLAMLITYSSDAALISPWQTLPWTIWPLFIAFSISLLWAGAKSNGQGWISDLSLSLFYFAFLSVAALVYRIGYGFDPFIHEASMRYIETHGTILPKTPYYLGQYGLAITLDRLLPLSLSFINRFLLPFLTAFTLAPAIRTLMAGWQIKEKYSFLATIVSLPAFAWLLFVTTPQNLGFLFLALSVIYALAAKGRFAWLLALAATCIHPISGLPALLSVLLINIYHTPHYEGLKKWLVPISIVGLPVIIITAFLATGANWQWAGWSGISSLAIFLWPFPNQENALLDTVYFFLHNIWAIGLAGLAWGIWRAKEDKAWWQRPLLVVAAVSLLTGIISTLLLSFDSLIFYEQQDYARRLLLSAWIISLPIIMYALADVARRIEIIKPKVLIPALACLLAIALYGSYPRFDNYHNSRGYSLSRSDIEAVHIAEEMAQGKGYVALANQQSSVGALREFGFSRYITKADGEQIYFYSIPTGGTLYQHYLSMVYEAPEKETMIRAMDEAGVDTAFLLVSRYWWASDKIIAEAKLVADEYQMTSDGEIAVFRFER